MAGSGRATLVLALCIFAGAVVGFTGFAIALARICFCSDVDPLDHLARGMFLAGFGACAVGALGLLSVGAVRLIERADRRAIERANRT